VARRRRRPPRRLADRRCGRTASRRGRSYCRRWNVRKSQPVRRRDPVGRWSWTGEPAGPSLSGGGSAERRNLIAGGGTACLNRRVSRRNLQRTSRRPGGRLRTGDPAHPNEGEPVHATVVRRPTPISLQNELPSARQWRGSTGVRRPPNASLPLTDGRGPETGCYLGALRALCFRVFENSRFQRSDCKTECCHPAGGWL
jgi:hypothetical protein